MPQVLRKGYLTANNNAESLLNMFNKDVQRIKVFKDWSDEQLKLIKAPTLVINSNADVGSPNTQLKCFALFQIAN